MCEISNHLKFCTCLAEEDLKKINVQKSLNKFYKKQLPNSKEPYTWILYEFMGHVEVNDLIRGMVSLPSDKIGFDLTEEFVLNYLNNQNCFDFNYNPKEGDNLHVNFQRNKFWTEFLSFIFRNNQWEPDDYKEGSHKVEPKNYGILKVSK